MTKDDSSGVVSAQDPYGCLVIVMTGSIAATIVPSYVLQLRIQRYAREIRVVMTRAATRFVTPMAMRAMSGHPVLTDMFDARGHWSVSHTQVSEDADAVIVLPATANILAKAAAGIADDCASSVIVGATCPVVFVPNMNEGMWRKPSVQRNVQILRGDGCEVVAPGRVVEVSNMKVGIGGAPSLKRIMSVVRTAVRGGNGAEAEASGRAPRPARHPGAAAGNGESTRKNT